MTNSTTDTYKMKREIVKFSEKNFAPLQSGIIIKML